MTTLRMKNFAKSTLADNLPAEATVLHIKVGDGSFFPLDGPFRAVIWGSQFTTAVDDPNREIVTLEYLSSDFFSAIRQEEDTDVSEWSVGDKIAHVLTAGKLLELEAIIPSADAQAAWSAKQDALIPGVDFVQPGSLATKAPLNSPNFTGTPVVPTAATITNTQQAASTAFVQNVISQLIGQAPETLNQISELATALADDPNFATTVAASIGSKVTANAGIVGGTHTKITYDAKGLITGGSDATTADIPDSNNRRYLTEAEKIILDNTAGINSGDQSKEGVPGLKQTDSPEFADVAITSLTVDATLGNTAKSIKSYLLSLWNKLSVHLAILNGNPHGTTAVQVGAEPALGNPDVDGMVMSSTAAGARFWIANTGSGTSPAAKIYNQQTYGGF